MLFPIPVSFAMCFIAADCKSAEAKLKIQSIELRPARFLIQLYLCLSRPIHFLILRRRLETIVPKFPWRRLSRSSSME